MEYKIPQNLLQAITDYLISRPYGEVWKLINAIQNLQPIETEDKPDKNQPRKSS